MRELNEYIDAFSVEDPFLVKTLQHIVKIDNLLKILAFILMIS